MNRIFIRQFADMVKQDNNNHQLNIGVTGLSQSAGATTIASTLAFYFAQEGKSVTFCQCINTGLPARIYFDEVAMNQRFAARTFTRFYEKVKGEVYVTEKENIERGIRWVLPTTEDMQKGKSLSETERSRLIRCCRNEVCVFDFCQSGDFDEYLQDMDIVIVVADCLPSALIAAKERYRKLRHLKESGCNVIWMGNKWNKNASKRQIRGYMHEPVDYWVDEIPMGEIYKDEYACRFHWDNKEIRSILLPVFTKLSHEQGL